MATTGGKNTATIRASNIVNHVSNEAIQLAVSHPEISTTVQLAPNKKSLQLQVSWPEKAKKVSVCPSQNETASVTPVAASSSEAPAVTKKPALTLTPSNVESRLSGGTADVLPEERSRATFDAEKMTNILDGGPEATARRRFILSPTSGTSASHKYYLTRPEVLKEHVKHFMETHESFWDSFLPTRMDTVWMTENSMMSGSLMNHYGLFLPTLLSHCSNEQRDWWLYRCFKMQIVGSYAQTELGHGSNVRGLQTTAVYDKSTKEFVLNTPTLRSIKWWPGALAKVSTHCALYAQLIIDGKEYGVHAFILQLRDENHLPLPGIQLGDLGPKLGDHANDTGYLILDNVRIPREYMLARHQHIDDDGNYTKAKTRKSNSKIHYTTMLNARGVMTRTASGNLARAVTIATRYSAVRTQGFVDKSATSYTSAENKILDYQVQRYRILKQLALAYCIKFTGSWLIESFDDLGSMDQGDIDSLPELAATSGGLKALCTYMASQGIEDCRKCCGGNGYLLSSGVAALAGDYVWQTTAEGDFIILMLFTAKFLLKKVEAARQGKPMQGPVSYLAPLKDSFDQKPPMAKSPNDYMDLDFLSQVFEYSALRHVVRAEKDFKEAMKKHGNWDKAWKACGLVCMNAVKIHCLTFLYRTFKNKAKKVEDAACKSALSRLCALFATSNILDDSLLSCNLAEGQWDMVKSAVIVLLDDLRPDAVAFVDAFDIPDRVLNSTLGRHDGNIYEALFEAAQQSNLNKQDPFVGYEEHLRPYLDLDFLKLKNKIPPSSL